MYRFLDGFAGIVMAICSPLIDLYVEIELTRDGGFTCAGRFYPFPERFTDTEHAEAFRGVVRHALWGKPCTLGEIRRRYARGFGIVISEAAWLEVVTWFMDQGLLREMIADDGGEVRYFSY